MENVQNETIKDWLTYDEALKFEIKFSKSGVARIFIGNRKTSFCASGYGYDKTSSVIASMINELIGALSYKKEIYGNRNGMLSGGTGFGSIQSSFNSIKGNKLECLYYGVDSDIYSLQINKKIKNRLEKELEDFYKARGY